MHRLQVGQHQHAASYCRVGGEISCVGTNRPVTTTEIAGYFWPALGVFSVFSATIWAKFVDEEAYPASLAAYFANYFHEGDGILYIRQATSKIADPLTRRRTILASCWEGGAKSFREEEESKKRCWGEKKCLRIEKPGSGDVPSVWSGANQGVLRSSSDATSQYI